MRKTQPGMHMKKTLLALTLTTTAFAQQPYTVWKDHLGGIDSPQYSALKQINKVNVSKLRQAWFYPSGDNGFRYGFNPTVIDGRMYVVGLHNAVTALDAATGKLLWSHDLGDAKATVTHRGVAYWQSKDAADRRILFSAGDMLQALDARTGKPIMSFGDNGKVNLRVGLGRDPDTMRRVQSGDPGRVFENLLILGSAPGEEYESPPGDLRAYDTRTGKLMWTFHTVPHPGEMGYDTWPKDAYKWIGGVNAWGEISIDEKRGIAYFPLGSPTYDFYGADRKGSNLFSDCILALDARTGKYLWHFQTPHHDLWDYDLVTAPKLLTIKHDGKNVDAIVQPTKQGFLFVLDRVTGKPVWPIEERKVPKSDVPGEETWPTQPFPTMPPPYSRQVFKADDVNPYISDPKERERFRTQVANSRNLGLFTPPALSDTMQIPGNNGGANWGSVASDPTIGWVYVASKEWPSMLKLETAAGRGGGGGGGGTPAQAGMGVYQANCQTCHQANLGGQLPEVPSLQGIVGKLSADRIRAVVKDGQGSMPGSNLAALDIDHLITYLTAPTGVTPVAGGGRGPGRGPAPAKLTPGNPQRYWTGYGYMNASDGFPAIKPPFFVMTAYDLNKGTIEWQIPVGEIPELVAKGIRNTGSIATRGGPIVTAGGLVIIPSQSDKKLWIYDKDTGKTLAELQMPAAPEGVPSTFEVNGKQYIAVPGRDTSEPRLRPGEPAPPVDPNKKVVQGYYVFTLE